MNELSRCVKGGRPDWHLKPVTTRVVSHLLAADSVAGRQTSSFETIDHAVEAALPLAALSVTCGTLMGLSSNGWEVRLYESGDPRKIVAVNALIIDLCLTYADAMKKEGVDSSWQLGAYNCADQIARLTGVSPPSLDWHEPSILKGMDLFKATLNELKLDRNVHAVHFEAKFVAIGIPPMVLKTLDRDGALRVLQHSYLLGLKLACSGATGSQ